MSRAPSSCTQFVLKRKQGSRGSLTVDHTDARPAAKKSTQPAAVSPSSWSLAGALVGVKTQVKMALFAPPVHHHRSGGRPGSWVPPRRVGKGAKLRFIAYPCSFDIVLHGRGGKKAAKAGGFAAAARRHGAWTMVSAGHAAGAVKPIWLQSHDGRRYKRRGARADPG